MMKRALLLAALIAAPAFADVPISGLPAGSAITGAELVPVVQSAVTVQTTPAALNTYIQANSTKACNWAFATQTLTLGTQALPCTLAPLANAANGASLTLRGGASNSAGNGGTLNLVGGAAFGTNHAGGSVALAAGAATGSGSLGSVTLTSGTDVLSLNGSGDINLAVNTDALVGLTVTNSATGTSTASQLEAKNSQDDSAEFGMTNPTYSNLVSPNINGANGLFAWVATFSQAPFYFASGFDGNGLATPFAWADQNQNYLQDRLIANATTDTNGFFYLGSAAGVPTGVPANITGNYAHSVPLRYDSTDNRLYAYNGAWRNLSTGGTVTSAATTVPAPLTATGCTITTSGTCAITWTAAQTANQVLATPSGTTGAVSLRSLALLDLPAGTALLGTANVFTANQEISTAEPRYLFNETDQSTDLKLWDWDLNAGVYCLRTRTDADGAGVNAECFTRGATTALASIMYGNATNNPAYQFLGTGTVTLGGGLSTNSVINAGRFQATASAVPSNGMYLPAANTLGFASNTTNRLSIDSTGAWLIGATAGSAGQVLTSNGAGTPPTWSNGAAGSFTGTLTGMASATTATCNYNITGGLVVLTCNGGAGFAGTSNANSMTLTGAPSVIFPSVTRTTPYSSIEDNSIAVSANASVATNGVITFHTVVISGANIVPNQAFTSTGGKGVLAGWYIEYPL